MDHGAFVSLMETVARGWNEGDARLAAECFADDAVYVEPPDLQRYEGRVALFEFFGGDEPPSMSMTWHHLAVDGEIGFGEYTFRGGRQYHGIVVVRIRDGLIDRWREYQYVSDQDWEAFVGPSRFG